MANYLCAARTNYFKVRDVVAFREWASQYCVSVIRDDHDLVGLLNEDPDGGSWPSYDPETDEEICFTEELSKHLQEGQVAILMEAGAEKLRYVFGQAVAVDHEGNELYVNLRDIYKLVEEEWGARPTPCEY